MRHFAVIVHATCVDYEILQGNPDALRVRCALEMLRERYASKGHGVIDVRGLLRHRYPGMPAPADDLSVKVCGAYGPICVGVQEQLFGTAGYRVSRWAPGTLDISVSGPVPDAPLSALGASTYK